MTCRVRSTRESRRLSRLEKVPEDFFQVGKHSALMRCRCGRERRQSQRRASCPRAGLRPTHKAGFWSAFDDNPCGSEAGRAE
jgi:hypothetical protein